MSKINPYILNFFISAVIIAAIYFITTLVVNQIDYYRSTEIVCVESTKIKRIIPEVSSCSSDGQVVYELENGTLYSKDYSGSSQKFTKEGEELCLREERKYKE